MPSKENLKMIFSPASVYETFWEQIYYILLSAHVLWGRRWDERIVLKWNYRLKTPCNRKAGKGNLKQGERSFTIDKRNYAAAFFILAIRVAAEVARTGWTVQVRGEALAGGAIPT
jgi:hypothetical protein